MSRIVAHDEDAGDETTTDLAECDDLDGADDLDEGDGLDEPTGTRSAAPGGPWLSRLLIAGSLAAVLVVVLVSVLLLRPDDDGGSASGTPSATSADAGFARDMAVHHQQAVELSFIVRDRTDDDQVRTLAYDIINTQANQRGMLLGWLETWGLPKSSQQPPMSWMTSSDSMSATAGTAGMKDMKDMKGMEEAMNYKPHDGSLMPGMATNKQMDELRHASGKAAEIMYLQLMTAHHQGGITMSESAAQLARTDEVRNLAAGMAASQQSEIRTMADMLTSRGAKP